MNLALASLVFLAAASPTAPAEKTAPAIQAARLTEPVTVDGLLKEAVWQNAEAATDFKQRDPEEGVPPSQRTEVRIAFDDDALYVGARLYDTVPDSILARLARRDVSIPSDRFCIYLDPYHDRRTGYYFMVNAAGTHYDGTLYNDSWDDDSWDGVWEAKPHIDAQGWTLEMRIPFSQLRSQRGENCVWGVNFKRVIPRRNEEDYLVYQPKKGSGFVSRFPDLVGIETGRAGRSIEILPYLTTKAEYLQHKPLDPFHDGSRYEPDGGADLRMGVGSRLTLNATINPDFGQVEVDPAVVNLSDAETYFQEKRPFFVEGSSNFGCGNQGANDYWGFNWPEPTFFYSRRIGRNPQIGAPSNADFVDYPVGTSILGAAKLTGKISPTWNFGTLHALTARENADLAFGPRHSEFEVEPLTYYGVTRGLKEFKNRQQGLGAMTTMAIRSFDAPQFRDQLNRQSFMTAMDGWVFLDKSQTWVISGWSAVSRIEGSKERITSVQRNSLHYFQRPDADHVEVDANATSLTGFGSRYWLNKQKGSTFCNAALGFMTPSFDVNDVGFMTRADVINGHFGGGYKWTQPNRIRKYQDVLGAVFASYDFQGNPIWGGVWGGASTEYINNYSWSYRAAYNPQTVNNRRTRGGPLTLNRPGYELTTSFDTDSKKKLFYFVSFDDYTTESNSVDWYVSPGVEWKPVSNILVRIGPTYEHVLEDAKWLGSYADPLAAATFGRRELFAKLDQKTVSADLRLNCTFTPNLSLQLFVQPLISSGSYSDFKELARARSYDFTHYSTSGATVDEKTGMIDPDGPGPAPAFTAQNPDFGFSGNPDFNTKSLRGNAVLRWEYMPGSTLYLAWTQQRNDFENMGELDLDPSFRRLGQAKPDNIFLAKVSYYFNM